MAAKKKLKEHPCIAKVDAALNKQGSQLKSMIYLDGSPRSIYVATEKMEFKRKPAVILRCNFCPFCGEEMAR